MSTKTVAQPSGYFERPRLVRRALHHLAQGPLAVIAAAGYGKTTLLHALAAQMPGSVVVPLTLADQDVGYLDARLQPHLASSSPILLDDVHVLEGADQVLDWLVQHIRAAPERWVLSGRWLPTPLAHALHALPTTYLTERDLALTPEEVARWLRPIGYTAEQSRAWHARTGGWPLAIAALVHIAHLYTAPEHIETSLEAYLHTHIFQRLWETLPPDVRAFLQLTGVALQFSPDMAVHLWQAMGMPDAEEKARHIWQEVARRRLFVDPGTREGYWRYHELFRAFLRAQTPDRKTIARHIVTWFHRRNDYDLAIEQALADELWDEATRLILDMPMEVIWNANRVYTYRRWILGLPKPYRERHPILLTRLAAELCSSGAQEEGWQLVIEGARLLKARGDPEATCQAYHALGHVCFLTGRYKKALEYGHRLWDGATDLKYRLRAAGLLSNVYALLGNFPRARYFYRAAIPIAEKMGHETIAVYQRSNLAANVLAPMGYLEEAEALLEQDRSYYQERPSPRMIYLEQWVALYAETGAWERIRKVLIELEGLVKEVETVDTTSNFWRFYYWALYHIGAGEWDNAEKALAQTEAHVAGRNDRHLCLAQLRAWLARRQGRPEEAVRIAEEALSQPWDAPFPRALVALERDIAATEAYPLPPSLHPDTRFFIQARALPSLIRLRGLLAWRCHREGRPEARRHLRALLHVLRRFPRLRPVLTDRDPELGFQVWRVALLLGFKEEMVIEALGRIGRVAGLEDLLLAPDAAVRRRAAWALQATRREEAMPALQRGLKREKNAHVRAAMEQALNRLEALPPPPLKVQFMGAFRVWRGDKEIPESAWPRPAVVRLFQYFVLHRGQPLTRDRILADLWPDQNPQQAAQTLRRLLSWLRQVLEPYMRAKGPIRYLSTTWDVFTFDPEDRVWVDVEVFERTVQKALEEEDRSDAPPPLEACVQALEAWAPPVSVAPYEAWWVERAERWQRLYQEGCLFVARRYLEGSEFRQAILWADRVLAVAPWVEAAYQVKMRALARLGERAQALAVYEEARAALARELDVGPSALTEWLAERLRRGEMI